MDKDSIKEFHKTYKKAESLLLKKAYKNLWEADSIESGWVKVEERNSLLGGEYLFHEETINKASLLLSEAEELINDEYIKDLNVNFVRQLYVFQGRIAAEQLNWDIALEKFKMDSELGYRFKLIKPQVYEFVAKVLCLHDKRDEAREFIDQALEFLNKNNNAAQEHHIKKLKKIRKLRF